MFTGIIKAVGTIERIEKKDGELRLAITAAGLTWAEYAIGESISVNGVCLTAVEFRQKGFIADVSSETIDVTALANLAEGSRVNLEPSISMGERLGGHLVSGHVDGVGRIKTRDTDARSVRLNVEVPAEVSRYIAKKGSVCIDGVSLTVNEVSGLTFDVNIIPHTAEVTIIGDYQAGTEVNIEVDLLARYIERLLDTGNESGLPSAITKDFLRTHGYA